MISLRYLLLDFSAYLFTVFLEHSVACLLNGRVQDVSAKTEVAWVTGKDHHGRETGELAKGISKTHKPRANERAERLEEDKKLLQDADSVERTARADAWS